MFVLVFSLSIYFLCLPLKTYFFRTNHVFSFILAISCILKRHQPNIFLSPNFCLLPAPLLPVVILMPLPFALPIVLFLAFKGPKFETMFKSRLCNHIRVCALGTNKFGLRAHNMQSIHKLVYVHYVHACLLMQATICNDCLFIVTSVCKLNLTEKLKMTIA